MRQLFRKRPHGAVTMEYLAQALEPEVGMVSSILLMDSLGNLQACLCVFGHEAVV